MLGVIGAAVGTDGAVLRAAAALLAGILLPAAAAAQEESGYDYPEQGTPPKVLRGMLELAGVSSSDTLYDLGSGDGRIVIRAAEQYGAAGVGIEIDADLVAEARRRAREAGVEGRVRFLEANFFEVDLRPATVVTTYLLPGTMDRLRTLLFRELRPGTRVVSHDFGMDGWPADTTTGWWGGVGGHTTLYRWVVPARVGGTWVVRPERGGATGGGVDEPFTLRIDQNFARLRGRIPEGRAAVDEIRIEGDSIRIRLSLPDRPDTGLTGTASLSRMEGRTEGGGRWTARRTAFSDSSLVAWSDSAKVGSR